MKPAPGRYRLATPPPTSTMAVVTITEAGMVTTFGYLEWVDDPLTGGAFICGPQVVQFTSETTFTANNGSSFYAGTCTPMPS